MGYARKETLTHPEQVELAVYENQAFCPGNGGDDVAVSNSMSRLQMAHSWVRGILALGCICLFHFQLAPALTRTKVAQHKVLTACGVLVVVSVMLAAILGPVCSVLGCKGSSRKHGSSSANDFAPMGARRIILRFSDEQIDAVNVLAQANPLIANLTKGLKLSTSSLQILDFVTEDVLQQARAYLRAHPKLDFLLRDVVMRQFTPLDYRAGGLLSGAISLPDISAAAVAAAASAALASANLTEIFGAGSIAVVAAEEAAAAAAIARNGSGSSRRLQELTEHVAAAADGYSSWSARKLQQATAGGLKEVMPNDANYSQQWFHKTVKSGFAWPTTTGGQVVVAVIDCGVDVSHPDLAKNLWVNPKEIPNNGIDDDNNGYIDDVNGWDFRGRCTTPLQASTLSCTSSCVGKPSTASDASIFPSKARDEGQPSHGCHCAGLVGALQNNLLGGTGVAPNVKLMILKVTTCGSPPQQTTSDIVSAFDYALKNGAHIVSVSIGANYATGFYPYQSPDMWQLDETSAYLAALQPLQAKGVLVIAAAGNEAIDMDNLNSLGWPYNPCLVGQKLNNVMCIGATDPNDHMASFSNFGVKTAHLAAPGTNIYSTILGGYGVMSGTSMATPITAGAAALVLSALGATDGNYYRAAQVKSILMSSGDVVPGLPVISGRRLNVYNAVQLATSNSGTVATALTFDPSSNATAFLPGIGEAYYGSATGLPSTNGLSVFDRSLRDGSTTNFTASKYGAGYLLRASSLMRIRTAGLYTLRVVTTASSSTYQLSVGGAILTLNCGIATISFGTAGWYAFELLYVNPAAPLDISFKAFGSSTYSYLPANSFYIATDAVSPEPPYAPPYPITLGFSAAQVSYNKVSPSSLSRSTLAAVSLASAWQYGAILPDLSYTRAGALQTALFPPSVGGPGAVSGVVGVATARLVAGWDSPLAAAYQFQVLCSQCVLYINGLVVLDAWSATTTALGASATRTSTCTPLPAAGYNWTLTFAASSLSSATLSVGISVCGGGGSGVRSLPSLSESSAWWLPSSAVASSLGGMQCDVWRNSSGAPPAYTANIDPTYKLRLPRSLGSSETLTTQLSTPFKFSLDSLLPGLATAFPTTAKGGTFSARCWSYWDGTFGSGSITATPASGTSVYLGYRQIWPPATSSPATSSSNAAPTTFISNGNLQLLVVEWTGLTATSLLSVQSGGSPMPLTLSNFMLPIGYSMLYGSGAAPSGRGLATTTYSLPTALEVSSAVQSPSLAGALVANAAVNTLAGLNTAVLLRLSQGVAYPRYAQASGYVSVFLDNPDTSEVWSFTFSDPVGQTSAVHMGYPSITVKNARTLSAATVAANSTFQVRFYGSAAPGYMDGAFLPSTVTLKFNTSDSKGSFKASFVSSQPATGGSIIDQTFWFNTRGDAAAAAAAG